MKILMVLLMAIATCRSALASVTCTNEHLQYSQSNYKAADGSSHLLELMIVNGVVWQKSDWLREPLPNPFYSTTIYYGDDPKVYFEQKLPKGKIRVLDALVTITLRDKDVFSEKAICTVNN